MAKRVVTRGRTGTGRSWVLDLPEQPHLSANSRGHWRERHQRANAWREAVAWIARAEGLPTLAAVDVALYVHPPDRRRRDPDNWFPAIKHCLDGLRDAGVLPDDSVEHVRRVSIVPREPDGSKRWRWLLEITEVSGG